MEYMKDTEIESSNRETSENSGEMESGTGEETEEMSVEELTRKLEESEKLVSEYLDHMQRLQAEFENYKKRMDKEKQEVIEYANAELMTELIDVMENLERGIASAKESEDKDSVVKGMEMVYTQLKDILVSGGLAPIECQGQKFDPYCHEAMMKIPSDEHPPNTVLEEFQRGYRVKDRVVRYSKVSVSTNEKNSK